MKVCVHWHVFFSLPSSPHLLCNPSALSDSSTMSYCLSASTTWFTSYDFSHSTGCSCTRKVCMRICVCVCVYVCHGCTCAARAQTHSPNHLCSTGAPWVSWPSRGTGYQPHSHLFLVHHRPRSVVFHTENFNHNIIRQVGVRV